MYPTKKDFVKQPIEAAKVKLPYALGRSMGDGTGPKRGDGGRPPIRREPQPFIGG